MALIAHIKSCNDANFILNYLSFKVVAVRLDQQLRATAIRLNKNYSSIQFTCSINYWSRFKARNEIRKRLASGELVKVEFTKEKVVDYLNVQLEMDFQKIHPLHIINLDESALFWLLFGSETFGFSKEEILGDTANKKRITIMGIIRADGFKYPLVIIDKSLVPNDLKNQKHLFEQKDDMQYF